MPVWVKVCGITRPEDARAAFEAGADAIGLNFVGGPREITLEAASAILEATPEDRVAVILVTLGPDGVKPSIDELLRAYGVRHVQMYGDVSPENVSRLVDRGYRLLLVCRLGADDLRSTLERAAGELASDDLFALVLDAHAPGKQGGTGKTLDWEAIAAAEARRELDGLPPIVLAGGLTLDNVGRAIRTVRPWGVDVSSGVESIPGKKDHQAVADFIRAARNTE